MVCEKAVHHLIAECNFDGISLDVGAIGSFGEMRLDSKVFYEYFIKVLAFIKRNPKFTGKTLSYLSYQDTTYNAEAPFEADKEHNHQMADLIDEVHIVGSLTGDYVYTPGESGVKDDKYFKCGIPKDKYFTFGSFNVDDSGLAFNSALAQIKKNSQCRGITGIYHDAEEKISPPPTSPEQSSYWKNRLSYYSELLQAETSNKGDKVIMK